jgi:hypothetical protein
MSDGIRQWEHLARAWTDAQQRLWSDMLGMSQTSASVPTEAWNRTIDLWERSVNQALDAQADWVRAWAESVTSAAGSQASSPRDDTRAWVRPGQEAFQHWNDQQKQLWAAWFSMARQLVASSSTGAQQMQSVVQRWQEAMRQAMHTQSEWTQRWAEAARQGASAPRQGRGSAR